MRLVHYLAILVVTFGIASALLAWFCQVPPTIFFFLMLIVSMGGALTTPIKPGMDKVAQRNAYHMYALIGLGSFFASQATMWLLLHKG